jgi:phosphate:Na+ symporter
MSIALFGGLAVFLFGMERMSESLEAVAGERMKSVLRRFTRNRVSAAITGTVVTAVIQSSSVTTVLVVGFVSAGLMSMTQSIGIIMGANVGTTVTAQLVAFDITRFALPGLAVGFALRFFARSARQRLYGEMMMGVGFLFLGMATMSQGMAPLRAHPPFLELMKAMEQPLLAILVAAAFTALVQSSSATTGIVIVLAAQGCISLPAGIAMALGANIGTCATALLAAIGKPTEALRAAAVHVVFNLAGALLWLGLIDQLAQIATWLSPSHAGLPAAERLALETPRQIANANTAFNLINAMLLLPLAGALARLVEWLIPLHNEAASERVQPKFLDPVLLETPLLALANVRLELGHLGGCVRNMLLALRPAAEARDREKLAAVGHTNEDVDRLHQAILAYLAEIRARSHGVTDADPFRELLTAAAYLDNAGDVIASELLPLVQGVVELEPGGDEVVQAALRSLGSRVASALDAALTALVDADPSAAHAVIAMKPEIDAEVTAVLGRQSQALAALGPGDVERVRLELGVLDKLGHLYTIAKRIARELLTGEGAASQHQLRGPR